MGACPIDLHVTLNGSDENPGTREKPLATLARAIEIARRRRAGKPSEPPARILVHEGTHYLTEPLRLGQQDSGAPSAPLLVQAAPGEAVTLSGGRLLSPDWETWREATAENGPILRCRLTEQQKPLPPFSQLFANGRREVRARFPNGDCADPSPENYAHPTGADTWPHHEIHFDADVFSPREWQHPEEAVVHCFAQNYWGNMQWRLRDVDRERGILRLGEGGWQLNTVYQRAGATGVGTGSRFFVENVFEELDAPREWYYDAREGWLYYAPPADLDLASARFEVSHLKRLVEIAGSPGAPVHHAALRGFRLAHVEPTFLEPYETPSLGDWTIHRGGAVFVEHAEDCAVEECFFDAVGGNGVFVSGYARGIGVRGNRFSCLGESAVCLVGESHLNTSKSYRCPYCGAEHGWGWDTPSAHFPADCDVSNNLIHGIGVFGKQTAGVFVSIAARIHIAHNLIYNTPRAGICLNDGWHGGHVIEWNDVHDTVRETGDHGPFNSWGRERYWCHLQSHGPQDAAHSHPAGDVLADARETTVIRHNRFRDDSGWGIDLDDGSSNYDVIGNLCIGIGIKLREGAWRTVENNVVINPAATLNTHLAYEDNHDRIVRNIVVIDTAFDNPESDVDMEARGHGGACIRAWIAPPEKPIAEQIDHNLYYSDRGEFVAGFGRRGEQVREIGMEEWRALGFGKHSVFARPLFVDPASGDFRVRADSPAVALGFRNFAMNRFGLLGSFPSRWLAETPER